MTPAPAVTPALVEADAKQAITFFATLYPAGRGEIIHFRGVPEPKDGRPPQNLHYALDEHFSDNVRGFLDWCAVDGRAAFFLPGTMRGAGTKASDVESLPAVVIDFDKGNPDANLGAVEALLGPATIILESGGVVDGHPKLHAYWRLAAPATGDDIATACHVREALARAFGGDPAFQQPAQVIRLPGSLHLKGAKKLVQLRTIRPEAVYQLADLVAKAPPLPKQVSSAADFFNFNNVDMRANDVERALTAPVHEGGVDDITRFEAAGKAIGHFIRMVREGRMTPAEAWEATKDWNTATLVPPWDEDRLRNDFERLVRADEQARGPLVAVAPVLPQAQAEGWSVADWRADRFKGEAPKRVWVVEGMIPAGTAGVFAAVGDAGKSMMALKLALHITTAPGETGPLNVSAPMFFGQAVTARGAAVVLTAEDDAAEVHRRLNGLDPSHARAGRPLYVVPMLATGGARSVLIDGPAGPVQTDFWRELRAQLLAIPDLKLVVLDPLSSFVSADINKDNVAGAALMTMLGELAATSGAGVMLVHHFAKGMVPADLSDARSAIRGAGALVDNGRWAVAMWEADQDKAYGALKSLGQAERARSSGLVYFGGLAKGNAPGVKTMRTLVRSASTGLLEDQTDTIAAATPRADEVDDKVIAALRHHKAERPRWVFPIGKSSAEKYIKPVLRAAKIELSVRAIETCLERLLDRGLLVETENAGKYEPAPE